MDWFDATASFGPYRIPALRQAYTAEELLSELDYSGNDRALVYHTAQRYDSPSEGNRIILDGLAGHARLLPTWVTIPTHTGELPPVDAFIAQMAIANVQALRLFPDDHRYFLDEVSLGDQLRTYADRKIPLFIRASLDQIGALLKSFPDLVVVTGTQGGNLLDRFAWPLVARFPNLYLETAGYLVDGVLEAFCGRFSSSRLIYSSGFPDQAPGASKLMLKHADITPADVSAIAHGNLERILAEADLQ
jgi:hypothetical protein